MTRGPPLSPSQASFPPSAEPAQTKFPLIQCFFPDCLQKKTIYEQEFAGFWNTHKNMRMQSTFDIIGRGASLRIREAPPPDLFAPQPAMKPTLNLDFVKENIILNAFTRPAKSLLCCGRHIGRILGWYSRGPPAIFNRAMSFSSLLVWKSGWTMISSRPLSMWPSGSLLWYRWWSPRRSLRLLTFDDLTN